MKSNCVLEFRCRKVDLAGILPALFSHKQSVTVTATWSGTLGRPGEPYRSNGAVVVSAQHTSPQIFSHWRFHTELAFPPPYKNGNAGWIYLVFQSMWSLQYLHDFGVPQRRGQRTWKVIRTAREKNPSVNWIPFSCFLLFCNARYSNIRFPMVRSFAEGRLVSAVKKKIVSVKCSLFLQLESCMDATLLTPRIQFFLSIHQKGSF